MVYISSFLFLYYSSPGPRAVDIPSENSGNTKSIKT